MLNEEWKDVPGYEGLYKVSNFGNVYSLLSHKRIKPHDNGNGYFSVQLRKSELCSN